MTLTFTDAERMLGKRATKKLAGNTYLRRVSYLRHPRHVFIVSFHGTDIVTIHQDGTFTLDARGNRSRTTKARINEFAPVSVYQRDFAWYLLNGQGCDAPFIDGITVDSCGRVIPSDPAERAALADRLAGADDTPSRSHS